MSEPCTEYHIDFQSDEDEQKEEEKAILLILDDFFHEDEPLQKKKRLRVPSVDFWSSAWGLVISDPSVWDPKSRSGKSFRRRFRVPFPLFKQVLLPLCKQHQFFSSQRHSRIPVEAKVLSALRILGRDSCADAIAELLQNVVGESSVNIIFKQFVIGMTTHVFPFMVKLASADSPDYLREVLATYERLGLPGCCGSLDGTRISWGMCPKEIRFDCIGKESHPTLVFMALVDHNRRVQYISDYYLGSNPDTTLCNNDPFLLRVQHGFLDEIQFEMYDNRGDKIQCKGGYYISDGGMKDCIRFVDPDHHRMARESVLWSEWIESVRKDVEC